MKRLTPQYLALALSFSLLAGSVTPMVAPAAVPTYRVGTSMARELRSADQMMQTGRYEEAETKYTALLSKEPGNAKLRGALAVVQAELYKLDASEKNAQAALAKDPNNAMAHVALGVVNRNRTASQDMVYRSMRDTYLSESERHLQWAVRIDPRSPEAHNQLGTTYRFQGRYNEALNEFQQAIKYDPSYAEALVNQGVIRLDQGNRGEAKLVYQRAIKMNSKNYAAHYRLGEAYLKEGDTHQAIRSLNTALALNRGNAAVITKLGEAYELQGNTSAAVSSYRKAIQENPAFMPAYVGLSNLFDGRGDGELAMAELKSALNVNPKYNPARNQLGRLALNIDKPDQAMQYYRESLQVNTNDPEALQGLSQALTIVAQKSATASQTLGQDSDLINAEKAVEEALRLNPNDMRLHLASLRLSQLAGKPHNSDVELQRIISTPANSDGERMVQGEAYLALGRYTDADTVFREQMQKASRDPDKLVVIGDVLKANGDLQRATDAYKMAIAADPNNIKAQRSIQRVEKVESESHKSLRLAKALNNWRQKESSIDFYEDTLSQNPRQPEARLALAKLYEKYRKYDKAAVSYQHYLGLMPNLPEKNRQHFTQKINKLQLLAQKTSLQEKAVTQTVP